jgi:hypothetical protein
MFWYACKQHRLKLRAHQYIIKCLIVPKLISVVEDVPEDYPRRGDTQLSDKKGREASGSYLKLNPSLKRD